MVGGSVFGVVVGVSVFGKGGGLMSSADVFGIATTGSSPISDTDTSLISSLISSLMVDAVVEVEVDSSVVVEVTSSVLVLSVTASVLTVVDSVTASVLVLLVDSGSGDEVVACSVVMTTSTTANPSLS